MVPTVTTNKISTQQSKSAYIQFSLFRRKRMIPQGRSTILEEPLSNVYCRDTSYLQKSEIINQPSVSSYCQFPSELIPTLNPTRNQICSGETVSTANQFIPYFMNVNRNNLTEASDIWTQSRVGEDGLHYYTPWLQLYPEDTKLSRETTLAELSNLPFGVNEPKSSFSIAPQQVLTDIYPSFDTNSSAEYSTTIWENSSNAVKQDIYNPTSNRLRHFSLPSNDFSHQQPSCSPTSFPGFSGNEVGCSPELQSELTNHLFHFVPSHNPSPTEWNNATSANYMEYNKTFLNPIDSYKEQPFQVSVDVSNQTALPNFYQFNFLSQSPFVPSNSLKTQTSSQMYNEIQHANQFQPSNYAYTMNANDLAQTHHSDTYVKTCENQNSWNFVSSVSNSTNFTHIDRTNRLSHLPLSPVEEPRQLKTSCAHDEQIETFVPKFYENMKPEKTKTEKRPLCLVKEARLSEQVKAQVDEFINSPSKRRDFKKYTCHICGRELARTATLRIHLRQHSGDRPFKCPSCPKSFAQPSLLKSHRRIHNGDRPYCCPLCHKTFTHSSALKTHMRTHTGERPHLCPVSNCGMTFSDSSTLSKHSRVHSGERPYPCDICGRRFTQSGNMNKHKRTVHKMTTTYANLINRAKIRENSKLLSQLLEDDESTMPL